MRCENVLEGGIARLRSRLRLLARRRCRNRVAEDKWKRGDILMEGLRRLVMYVVHAALFVSTSPLPQFQYALGN